MRKLILLGILLAMYTSCKDDNDQFTDATCFTGKIISNGACSSDGTLVEILSPDVTLGENYLDHYNVVTTFNLPESFRILDEIIYFQIEEIREPSTRVCLMVYGPSIGPEILVSNVNKRAYIQQD